MIIPGTGILEPVEPGKGEKATSAPSARLISLSRLFCIDVVGINFKQHGNRESGTSDPSTTARVRRVS
jgi:hypothetical protein